MKLRNYQEDALTAIGEQLATVQSTLVVMPTGGGKTVVFAHAIERFSKKRTLVLAHRVELIRQAAGKIEAVTGETPSIEMGAERADLHMFRRAKVVVASKDTLHPDRLKKFDPEDFDLVITDECFPAGTLVDGKPIEQVSVGDLVSCFDHDLPGVSSGRVSWVFKKIPDTLVLVCLADGSRLVCTACHPVWSQSRGRYVPAISLDSDDVVSRLTTYGHKYLQRMRENGGVEGSPSFNVLERVSEEGGFRDNGADQPETRFVKDESAEPHAACIGSTASVGNDASDGSRTSASRRQWQGSDRTGVENSEGARVDNRVCGKNENAARQWIPNVLQDRRGERTDEDRHRSRWWFSQVAESQSAGQEEGSVFEAVGVDRVEVLERGRDGTFGGLCPDGFVYNLEVEGAHTYFANSILVHNCHHGVGSSYRHIYNYFKDAKHIGVTATPDRTDEEALGQVFDSVAYVYEIVDAINDGWLVPVSSQAVQVTDLDFSKMKSTAGDLNQKQLAELMEHEKIAHGVAHPTVEIAKWRKTLVFAASVKAAEMIAEIINRHKPNSARCVFGHTHPEERAVIFSDYKVGKFQFLVNVGVATEGWDEPTVEMIAIARPTESRALYAQMCGRGTRPMPGIVDGCEDTPESRRAAIAKSRKPECLILDFEGNCGRHKLITTANILGGNYTDEVIVLAERKIRESQGAMPVAQALAVAEADLTKEREIARRQRLVGTATYETKAFDPFSVFDLAPKREREWDRGKAPSQPQIDFLNKNGVNTDGLTKSKASQIIGEIIERRKKGKCSYKQAKLLKKHGLDPNLSFEDAKKAIDEIATRQGWRKKEEFAT